MSQICKVDSRTINVREIRDMWSKVIIWDVIQAKDSYIIPSMWHKCPRVIRSVWCKWLTPTHTCYTMISYEDFIITNVKITNVMTLYYT